MPAPRYTGTLMPRPKNKSKQSKVKSLTVRILPVFILFGALGAGLFSLPLLLGETALWGQGTQVADVEPSYNSFPVTVDPENKTITQDPRVEKLLATRPSNLGASVGVLGMVAIELASQIANLPGYQLIASAVGINNLYVVIHPGSRTEQVANSFGSALSWTTSDKTAFSTSLRKLHPTLQEGSVVPGIYFASVSNPHDVATLVDTRFQEQIVSKYSSTTAEQVPLKDALTIASLLEREAGGWDDMRLISGVIWNRLFIGMKLQIDATLQYAEANGAKGKTGWWPSVEPKDKYIKSAYNTYQNAGLPPGPIANPSVAAVLAALNPKKTNCLFYFHDANGVFHCSVTYEEHVKMLKQYYGQGR